MWSIDDMKGRLLALAVICLASAAGCATSADVEKVERQTATINAELREIKGNLDEINFSLQAAAKKGKENSDSIAGLNRLMADNLKSLAESVEVVKRNQAGLESKLFSGAGSGEVKSLGSDMDVLKNEMDSTNAKLDAMKAAIMQSLAEMEKARPAQEAKPDIKIETAQGTVTGGGAGAQAQPAAKPESGQAGGQAPQGDPNQVYQAAYLDYTKGNFDLAVMGFREYIRSFPDGVYAGNAQYWIGESLYSLGKYSEALPEFEKVVGGYPSSPKVPGAMLKKGYSYEALKKPKEAREAYEELVRKFPNSESAKLAAEKLRK